MNALETAKKHIGGEITRDEDTLIVHRDISANDLGVLQNRIDTEAVNHSQDGKTLIRLERELHFISVARNDIRVVNASTEEVALNRIEASEFEDVEHRGTESGIKNHLRNHSEVHL